MLDTKRNIDEVLAIYLLEKDFIDFYVEGPTDKLIFQNFFDYKKKEAKVVEIDTIDFSNYRDSVTDLDLKSNKHKLIFFSRLLDKNNVNTNINCIVDRDFSGIICNLEENNYLLYTDYSCIESYIFCEVSIKKILDLGIRNFPFSSKHAIKEISNLIYFLSLIRILNEQLKLNGTLPKIENSFTVNKTTGVSNFSESDYLDKFIKNNKLNTKTQEINEFVDESKKTFTSDIRFYLNGHDFILIFFNYINKVKNSVNFKIDQFERAVYLSIQPDHLENYELFKKIS